MREMLDAQSKLCLKIRRKYMIFGFSTRIMNYLLLTGLSHNYFPHLQNNDWHRTFGKNKNVHIFVSHPYELLYLYFQYGTVQYFQPKQLIPFPTHGSRDLLWRVHYKVFHRSNHMYKLKHFGMVWQRHIREKCCGAQRKPYF
jgi:hypothetical protein